MQPEDEEQPPPRDGSPVEVRDIEDFGTPGKPKGTETLRALATKRKRVDGDVGQPSSEKDDTDLTRSWQEILGPPPLMGKSQVSRGSNKQNSFGRLYKGTCIGCCNLKRSSHRVQAVPPPKKNKI